MASSASQNLRRGLAVLSLFLVRGFQAHGGAGACDVAATPTTVARRLVVNDLPDVLVAGRVTRTQPSIVVDTTVPTAGYCEYSESYDEGDDGALGCSHGGGSAETASSCDGTWISSYTSTTYEMPIVLSATCGPSCTATVNADGSVSVTATTDTTLVVSARSPASGEVVESTSTLTVVPDAPRIAAGLASGPWLPTNVLLPGQTATWCVVGPTDLDVQPMAVALTGTSLEEVATDVPGCASFLATAKGATHVVFTTSDGKIVAADVTTVDPSDVTELQFVDPSTWLTGREAELSTTELIASATPLPSNDASAYYPSYESGARCDLTAAARFYTADGRTGLVPRTGLSSDTSRDLAVATLGTVSTSIPLEAAESCTY